MIGAALGALVIVATVVQMLVGVCSLRTEIEIGNDRLSCFIKETEGAVVRSIECKVSKAPSEQYDFISADNLIIDHTFINSDSNVFRSEPISRINNLYSFYWLFHTALYQITSNCRRCDSAFVFFRRDDRELNIRDEASCGLPSCVLISHQEINSVSRDRGSSNCRAVWPNPSAGISDDIVVSGGDAIPSSRRLILGGLGEVSVDVDLNVSLARALIHQIQLVIETPKLLFSRFPGVLESDVRYPIQQTSKYNREDKQTYRDLLSEGTAIIVGLLLILCAFKCISYAVDRRQFSAILIAFVLQTCGVATLLYVVWCLTTGWHSSPSDFLQ